MNTPEKNRTMTDMTVGNPYRLIFLFSLPLLLGNLLQQLYNMVDSIVVGNVIGDQALAAVGTGFPVIFMLTSLFMGIGTGATVMLSQFYGARDFERLRNLVDTLYTAVKIGIIPLTVLGILLSGPLLTLMKVPNDGTYELALLYLIIIFAGMIGVLGFNLNAAILQGLGDSKTSLLFLAIATVINIVLDLVFTMVFHMGVAGVALATIIAQIFSWLFGIWYINRHYDCIRIRLKGLTFHKDLFWQAMKLGIPGGIQQALFSFGIMFVQGIVNSYGSSFMAGFNGANKIDSFAFLPMQSFGMAVTTYAGQNVGAGKLKRVGEGLRASIIMCIGFSALALIILYPTSSILMRMFSQSPDVIDAGVIYLHSVLPVYCFMGINFMCNSTLRGSGEMVVPMVGCIVELWVIRLPAAYLLAKYLGPEYLFWSYGLGWFVNILFGGTYYLTGRWKKKRIAQTISETEPTETVHT